MTPKQLVKAIEERRAVLLEFPHRRQVIPAAVVQNWQFRYVMKLLPGMTIYRKKKRTNKTLIGKRFTEPRELP
jgi:hypothetical protein